jgi:hypothetical protein
MSRPKRGLYDAFVIAYYNGNSNKEAYAKEQVIKELERVVSKPRHSEWVGGFDYVEVMDIEDRIKELKQK